MTFPVIRAMIAIHTMAAGSADNVGGGCASKRGRVQPQITGAFTLRNGDFNRKKDSLFLAKAYKGYRQEKVVSSQEAQVWRKLPQRMRFLSPYSLLLFFCGTYPGLIITVPFPSLGIGSVEPSEAGLFLDFAEPRFKGSGCHFRESSIEIDTSICRLKLLPQCFC